MAKMVITARVTQEEFDRINQLVSDGIFTNRSAVLQTFVNLGLEYCNLGEDAQQIKWVLTEFRIKAEYTAQQAAIHSLVKSLIEELSCLIEIGQQHAIYNALDQAKCTVLTLSPDMYDWFIEKLVTEPIYQMAREITGG